MFPILGTILETWGDLGKEARKTKSETPNTSLRKVDVLDILWKVLSGHHDGHSYCSQGLHHTGTLAAGYVGSEGKS